MTLSAPAELVVQQLRDCPQLTGVVAERIWQAWWKDSGTPLEDLTARVALSRDADLLPSCWVVKRAGDFAGTASLIAHDLDQRPDLGPWVAAVWTEPSHRDKGVAALAIEQAVQAAFAGGYDVVYLCARSQLQGLYERLGWTLIERDVGPHALLVFRRNAVKSVSAAPDAS